MSAFGLSPMSGVWGVGGCVLWFRGHGKRGWVGVDVWSGLCWGSWSNFFGGVHLGVSWCCLVSSRDKMSSNLFIWWCPNTDAGGGSEEEPENDVLYKGRWSKIQKRARHQIFQKSEKNFCPWFGRDQGWDCLLDGGVPDFHHPRACNLEDWVQVRWRHYCFIVTLLRHSFFQLPRACTPASQQTLYSYQLVSLTYIIWVCCKYFPSFVPESFASKFDFSWISFFICVQALRFALRTWCCL